MGARPDQGAARGACAAAQPRPSGDRDGGWWCTLGNLLLRLGSCASRWAGATASAPLSRPLRGGGDEVGRQRPDGDEGGRAEGGARASRRGARARRATR
eukprot:1317634-Prymnesium_polylepis.1